jgi:hypothetical protein
MLLGAWMIFGAVLTLACLFSLYLLAVALGLASSNLPWTDLFEIGILCLGAVWLLGALARAITRPW